MDSIPQISAIGRIGWLIDSYSDFDESLMARTLGAINGVLDGASCTIEPIRVVETQSPMILMLRKFFFGIEVSDAKSFSSLFSSFDGRYNTLPTRIFDWGPTSGKSVAYYLSCYAQLNHIDMFVAPPGLSFRNILSMESKVPVLLVGRANILKQQARNILFPVIDPTTCTMAFRNLVDFSKLSKSKITLLVRRTGDPESQVWIPSNEQFDAIPFYDPGELTAETEKLDVLASWEKIARAENVLVEVEQDVGKFSFGETILNYQRKHGCDLLAFDPAYFQSAHKHELLRVVRDSMCPVWISRPIGQNDCKAYLRAMEKHLLENFRPRPL